MKTILSAATSVLATLAALASATNLTEQNKADQPKKEAAPEIVASERSCSATPAGRAPGSIE